MKSIGFVRVSLFSVGMFICPSLYGLGFGGLEVIKLDWATRSLNAADVDGDGLNDLVVVNNDLSKIEVYIKHLGTP